MIVCTSGELRRHAEESRAAEGRAALAASAG